MSIPWSHRKSTSSMTATAITMAVLAGLLLSSQAVAAGLPSWRVTAIPTPTNLSPGGTGVVRLRVANVGTATTDESSPVTVTDSLPPGVIATDAGEEVGSAGVIGHSLWDCTGAGTSIVTCTNDPTGMPTLAPGPGGYGTDVAGTRGGEAPAIIIAVDVPEETSHTASNSVTVSGGGAPEAATATQAFKIDPEPAPFEVTSFDTYMTGYDGLPASQAGSHPFEQTTSFSLSGDTEESGAAIQSNDLKNISVDLPPGLIGNPQAVDRCTREEFDGSESPNCPTSSEIGEAAIEVGGLGHTAIPIILPLFNLTPPHGEPAQFGFRTNHISTFLDVSLRTGGDYGATVTVKNAAQRQVLGTRITVWGVPADPAHDFHRCNDVNGGYTCGLSTNIEPRPFLTLPTACAAEERWSFLTDTWLDPSSYVTGELPAVDGQGDPVGTDRCNQLDFSPSIESKTTTNVADAPTGLDFDLHVPQNEEPEGLAEAELKNTVVTLPKGLVVNPSTANGLASCTEAQIELHGPNPPSCPDASKIGSVEVDTPLIDHPLPGAVYVAQPEQNPFGSLLSLYVVVDDPVSGVVVKLPAEVHADPQTGQLTTSVRESPQLPFEDFHLNFFNGAHAALRTPPACATYRTTSDLTPWTTPEGADASPVDSFALTQSPSGGPCPASEAQLPDKPNFEAGTLQPKAGAYSPFLLHLARADGTQEISAIDTTLPEGLIGKLAGVSECSDGQIAQAQSRSHLGEGALEQAHPSCPANSLVGKVMVGAGAGPSPYYVSGNAYLAGPYKGAALSLEIITPAVAGPYDLGAVAVRAALYLNNETSQIHAVSDPIPHILQGIPLDVRSINLELDRSQFTLNPTSCAKKQILGTATSVLGQGASLLSPFQVGDCAKLGFEPKLAIHLKGSTKRGGTPALNATLTYPSKGAYANIAKASVALPHSEFLDNAHIKTICTRVQFAEGATPGEKCPPDSIYGFAKATTPLLDMPVEGPVYLRSSSNKLPDLVAALNGQIDVDLDGTIDSIHGGIRNRFEVVPDAPVTRFTLSMQGGKKGLLENSTNLCRSVNRAAANFTAQNGLVDHYQPVVTNDCKSKPKAKKKKHHGAG